MKIDKASFLLLAGALSTSACIITTSDSDDDGDGTGGSGASTSSSGGSGGEVGTGGSGGDGVGGSGGGDGGAGGSGGACDDSVGTPADCGLVMTSCTESAVGDAALCTGSIQYFKPRVAQEATECIIALDSTATCPDVHACRNNALANACDDDVSVECAALVSECGSTITELECANLLPGFNETGRAQVAAQCGPTLEGCLGGGLYQSLAECVDNLAPSL